MSEENIGFSDDQIDEVNKWFDDHHSILEVEDNPNGKQYITIELLEQFHKDISFPLVEYSYYNIMKEAEKMKIVNGIIDKEEFLKFVNMWVILPKPIDELKVAFKVFDTENRGYLNIVELQHILRTIGDQFTAEELHEFSYDADMTGLGNVDCNKFVDSMFLISPNLADIKVDFIYPLVKVVEVTPQESIEKITAPNKKSKKKKDKNEKKKKKSKPKKSKKK